MAKRRRQTASTKQQISWPMIVAGIILILATIALSIGWLSSAGQTASVADTPATPSPTVSLTAEATATSLPPPPTPTTASASLTPTVASQPPPAGESSAETPFYSYEIVNEYPHDPEAFTQGLIYQDDILYEGTGLRGESKLRKVELETGQVIQEIGLAEGLFGEGITIFGDRLIQLTWQARVGFVYDKESFEKLQEFNYPTEGWGITHDGQRLIMSDGTSTLYFWDPQTLAEIDRLEVTDRGEPVRLLNELEYINGEIYANVWQTTRIARISPDSGQVLGWIELGGLLKPEDVSGRVDVLNGIAYDAERDRLFVTGKWWPKLFEINLIPLE